jgi:hypothetical protein
MLGVPLCRSETFGSYLRDPMYNKLQNRKLDVSAELRYVLSPEQIKAMSVEEIQAVIDREFSFKISSGSFGCSFDKDSRTYKRFTLNICHCTFDGLWLTGLTSGNEIDLAILDVIGNRLSRKEFIQDGLEISILYIDRVQLIRIDSRLRIIERTS